jgi:predicted nucleotidyltransferase component of viral defense system
MSKIQFLQLATSDRKEVFIEVATQKGMSPFAVEKDWWVSRTLDIIFQLDIAKQIVFKGGTSLSKAWGLIDRFSEDIDLAILKYAHFNSSSCLCSNCFNYCFFICSPKGSKR